MSAGTFVDTLHRYIEITDYYRIQTLHISTVTEFVFNILEGADKMLSKMRTCKCSSVVRE